jgi:hypothetical protein
MTLDDLRAPGNRIVAEPSTHLLAADAAWGKAAELADQFGAALTTTPDWGHRDILKTIDIEKPLAVEQATVGHGH